MDVHLDTQSQIDQIQELKYGSLAPPWSALVRFLISSAWHTRLRAWNNNSSLWHFIASSPILALVLEHNNILHKKRNTLKAPQMHMRVWNSACERTKKKTKKKKLPEWRRNLNLNASLGWRHHVGIQTLPGGEPVPAKRSERVWQ